MLWKLRLSLICTLTLLVLAAAPRSLFAQTTINVGPGQTYTTIQSGIDAANTGDTVLVAPGTYYENIDFKGKAITVTSSGGAASTILDGSSKAPAVTFQSSEPRSAILSGLTIQHGGTNSVPVGGILIANSSPSISNNIITLNNCWGIETETAAPLIQNNEISATQDPSGNCSFGGGAAIYVGGNLNDITAPADSALIIGNTIENNVESGIEDAGGNGGAAVAIWGGSPLIQNNIIRNNASPGGSGGAINVEGSSGTTIVQNLIYGNSAGCGGGGIAFNTGYVYPPGFDDLIANNTIVNNTGPGDAGFSECIDIAQIYPSPDTYGSSRFTAVLVNNIISGATAYPAVNCGQYDDPPSEWEQPIFDHNILYNSSGPFFGSFCIDVSGEYENITTPPQFVNAAQGNYQLKGSSPGIDAGNNSVLQSIAQLTGSPLTKDFAGNARLQDATGKGYPIIDIGAYEYSGLTETDPTTIVLVSSSYFGNAGSGYTLTANVASGLGVPTGPITFFLDGKSIGTSTISGSGVATFTNFIMPPGVHSLYATYAGQGVFTPALSVIIIVDIYPYSSTLTLTSSANPSNVGQPVTFTVTSLGSDNTPLGPVVLSDISTGATLATLTPNAAGVATYTTSTLTLGTHDLSAGFAGNSNYSSSSASLTQQVVNGSATTTTIISSLNPSTYGQSVTFTASVSSTAGTPTGSFAFTDGPTTLATVPIGTNGSASFTTSTLSANDLGTTQYHNITATYVPTGSFATSSASLQQVVNGLPSATTLTVTPNSGTTATTFTITATVSSASTSSTITPTGTVVFYTSAQTGITGNELGYATLVNGVATLTSTSLLSGTDYIVGIYFGDGIYASSTSNYFTLSVTNIAPAITLTSSANPAPALTPITFTAQVGATSGGSIIFSINGQNITTTPNAAGTATETISTLTQGSYPITATWFAPNSALAEQTSLTQVVTAATAAPDFSLTGTNITFPVFHSGTGDLDLTSLNNFSGPVALTCNPPYPPNYTCTLQYPSVALTPGLSSVFTFTLSPTTVASNHPLQRSTRIVLASFFPLSFLTLIGISRKRRTSLGAFLCLTLLAVLATTTTGCGPDHFIPITTGTFPLTFTATGTSQGTSTPITHTLTINATIAP